MESKLGLYVLRAEGHNDGVPRVVAARAARAYVHLGAEDVDELALAFVAPLRAQHDRRCPSRVVSMLNGFRVQTVYMHSPLIAERVARRCRRSRGSRVCWQFDAKNK